MARKKKKKRPLPPRRLQMRRPARLQAARKWLAEYTGKNLIRGYARWFAVDRVCAITELQELGAKLDPSQVDAARRAAMGRKRRKPDPPRASDPAGEYGIDWDEHFSVIAGFTAGGAPFGLTWEEYDPRSPTPSRETQALADQPKLSGDDRTRSELPEEIRYFLFGQSNISAKNVRRLEWLAEHAEPEAREIAAIVLEIARVHSRRRKRLKTIRAQYPKLWQRMVAAGIVQEYAEQYAPEEYESEGPTPEDWSEERPMSQDPPPDSPEDDLPF